MAPVNQPTAQLAIFRAGTHTSVDGRQLTFTPEIIREFAETYDPQVSEAPLVVGHPKLDDPAYGWAQIYARRRRAALRGAAPGRAAVRRDGEHGSVQEDQHVHLSAGQPGNPRPGKYYVKHIGFLGAAAPAVKGLPSVQFAENDGAVEFAAPKLPSLCPLALTPQPPATPAATGSTAPP